MNPLKISRLAGFGRKPPQVIASSPILLGTAPGSTVRFDPSWDKGVAPQHARIEWAGDAWVLRDLQSPAGIFIGGRRVTGPVEITGPLEFELGQGGPRCLVEPALEPAAAAPASPTLVTPRTSSPSRQGAPDPIVYRHDAAPTRSGGLPNWAILIGVILIIGFAVFAGLYFYKSYTVTPVTPIAVITNVAPLPPRIDDQPGQPPAPANNPSVNPPTPVAPTASPHPLGLIAPNANQLDWIRKSFPTVTAVKLNPIGRDRLMATRTFDTAPPVVAPGDELSTMQGEPDPSTMSAPVPDTTPLPSAVDNSQLPCFPGVGDQGQIGSCASFSTVYYAASHNMALVRGAKAGAGGMHPLPLSPRWTYPQVNGGGDNGSLFLSVLLILMNHGVPSVQEYPYIGDPNPPSNYLGWPTDPALWRDAMHNRFREVGRFINLDTDAGQQKLKEFLANGYLANYGTQVLGWQFKPAGQDPANSAAGNACAGQPVAWEVTSDNPGGHGMTIVGYNDDIWVDANGDGKMEPQEKGAFKIVNSWGNAEWPQGSGNTTGFAWLSYDALRQHSAIPGVDETHRIPAFMNNEAWYMMPDPDFKPTMLAQFTISNAHRNNIDIRLGVSTTALKEPVKVWRPAAITITDLDQEAIQGEQSLTTGMGGPLAFDGGTTEIPGTFVFDLDDLANSFTDPLPGNQYRFYLMVTDLKKDTPTTVSDFEITDGDGKVLAKADGLPKQIVNDTVAIPLDIPVPAPTPPPTPAPSPTPPPQP